MQYKGKSAIFALETKVKIVCFFGLTPAQVLQNLLHPIAEKEVNNSIMKKNTRLFVGIAMAVAIGGTLVSANAAVDKNAIKAAFAKAPGAEMPYIANSLVA